VWISLALFKITSVEDSCDKFNMNVSFYFLQLIIQCWISL
jgi:hypothetical protein